MRLKNLAKASLGAFLDSVPVAGTIFKVYSDMQLDSRLEQLEIKNSKDELTKNLVEQMEKIESRVGNVVDAVRELQNYNRSNDFIFFPQLLKKDLFFKEILRNPSQGGVKVETLAKAKKRDNCFSFVVYRGEFPYIYHVPIMTFGALVQNKSYRKEKNEKLVAYDRVSEAGWIVSDSNLFIPKQNKKVAQSINDGPIQRDQFKNILFNYLSCRFPRYKFEYSSGHFRVVKQYMDTRFKNIEAISYILDVTQKIRKNYNLNVLGDSHGRCSLSHLAVALACVDHNYRQKTSFGKECSRVVSLYDLSNFKTEPNTILKYLKLKFPNCNRRAYEGHYQVVTKYMDFSSFAYIRDIDNIIDKTYTIREKYNRGVVQAHSLTYLAIALACVDRNYRKKNQLVKYVT